MTDRLHRSFIFVSSASLLPSFPSADTSIDTSSLSLSFNYLVISPWLPPSSSSSSTPHNMTLAASMAPASTKERRRRTVGCAHTHLLWTGCSHAGPMGESSFHSLSPRHSHLQASRTGCWTTPETCDSAVVNQTSCEYAGDCECNSLPCYIAFAGR